MSKAFWWKVGNPLPEHEKFRDEVGKQIGQQETRRGDFVILDFGKNFDGFATHDFQRLELEPTKPIRKEVKNENNQSREEP